MTTFKIGDIVTVHTTIPLSHQPMTIVGIERFHYEMTNTIGGKVRVEKAFTLTHTPLDIAA